MADNDIYNNKGQYEKFKANLNLYLEEPKGFRKYQIKSRKNLSYFYKLMTRFEAADISYIRRLRLLRSFLIVCHSITRDLAEVDREDIDEIIHTKILDKSKVKEFFRTGRITDAKTICALAMLKWL